jgi:Flp pilus assembly CpaE family ATPase
MFQAEDLSALLLFFKRTCPLTVVDTGGRLDSPLVAATQDADLLLLVTTPALPSLRDTAKLIASFGRLDVTPDRMAVVVNHSAKASGFDPNIVGRTLGQEPLAVLPFDPGAVDRASNQGQPVGEGAGGALADSVEDLTATIIERLNSPHMQASPNGADKKGARRLVAAFSR